MSNRPGNRRPARTMTAASRLRSTVRRSQRARLRRRRICLGALAGAAVVLSVLGFHFESGHVNTTFNEIAIQPRPDSPATANADASAELAQATANGGQLLLAEIGDGTAAPVLDTELSCPPGTNTLICQRTTGNAVATAVSVARHLVNSQAPASLDLYAVFEQTTEYLSEHPVHYQAVNLWINTTGAQLTPVNLTGITTSSNIAALASQAVAAGTFPGPHACAGYTVHMVVPSTGSPGHQQAIHGLLAALIHGCGGTLSSWTSRWIAAGPAALPLPSVPGASVSQGAGVVTYTLSETLADFAVGSAALAPTADAALSRIASDIETRSPGRPVTCTGATDGTGTAAFDLTLSRQRAAAVCGYLASQGIDPQLLHPFGAGKATSNAADPSLRRVVITVRNN